MSKTYKVITNERINLKKIYNNLKSDFPGLSAEERDADYVYFYINGMSTRGVDVSPGENGYEIRNTVMSNKADLSLAFRIIIYLTEKTKSVVYDEDDNIIDPEFFTNNENTENGFIEDLKTIFSFIKNTGETIEFPGPTRSVFIGKNVYKENKNYPDDIINVSKKIEKIFLKVLYGLPKYYECSSFGANGKDGKIIKIKMLTSNDNFIIQDYDFIMAGDDKDPNNENEVIMLSPEVIRKILPDNWVIIDESTIVTSKLTDAEWKKFRDNCRKNNCLAEFDRKTGK